MTSTTAPVRVRRLGLVDYGETLAQMRAFTDARDAQTNDELWLLQHPPVFTLGQAGDPKYILTPGDIPVVRSDRGGQVTSHGPGQAVLYVMLDLRRRNCGVRGLVSGLEQAVVDTLDGYGIEAFARREAPGVYVDIAGELCKIASLGLRVRRGCSYHGLSLNVAMDLEPFMRIDPCGYRGLRMTQVSDLDGPQDVDAVAEDVARQIRYRFGLGQEPGPRVVETPRQNH